MLTFRKDGKTYQIPQLLVDGLSAQADRVAEQRERGDAIETAKVMFEHPDGNVELVLPAGTVDQMLAMVGATGSAPAAEPEAPVEGDMMGEENPNGVEGDEGMGADPALEEDGAEPFTKADAAKMISDAVSKAVGAALDKRDAAAKSRGELERTAAKVLDPGYIFDSADSFTVMADAVSKADAAKGSDAKALAERARRGDQRAAGKLEAVFEHAVSSSEQRADSTVGQLDRVFEVASPREDGAGGGDVAPWEKARQDRIAKASGAKETSAA